MYFLFIYLCAYLYIYIHVYTHIHTSISISIYVFIIIVVLGIAILVLGRCLKLSREDLRQGQRGPNPSCLLPDLRKAAGKSQLGTGTWSTAS